MSYVIKSGLLVDSTQLGLLFLKYPISLSLPLYGAFRPFPYTILINMDGLIYMILLLIFYLFHLLFLIYSFLFFLTWDYFGFCGFILCPLLGLYIYLCSKIVVSPGFKTCILTNQCFLFFLIYFYFWLCWVFVAAGRLSLVAASGGYSSLWCVGFSWRWLLLLWSMGSRHVGFSSCGLWALEHRLSSCGTEAQLLHGMWDLPRPGLEPVSPALAGGFLTTVPPGKPQSVSSYTYYYIALHTVKETSSSMFLILLSHLLC